MSVKSSPKFFQPIICWVVALRAEALPLITILDLKSISNDLNFPIYSNAETGHALVISGVGTVRSAAAATYLRMVCDVKSYTAWINFGIAGYYCEPVGQIFQAVKVYDRARGRSYFPGVRFKKIIASETLYTVVKPENLYLQPVLFDMEAAGFCEITPSFCCNELIFVFKIVSDTPENSVKTVSRKQISKLIYKNIDKIEELISKVLYVVEFEKVRLYIPKEVLNCLEMYHFSETNRHKFLQVYRKWKAAFPDRILHDTRKSAKSAKELICSLENELLVAAKHWKLS